MFYLYYIALQISPFLSPTPTSVVKARGPGDRQIVISSNAKAGILKKSDKASFFKKYMEYCWYVLFISNANFVPTLFRFYYLIM